MKAIKIILGTFAGLWLLSLLMIGAGGAWVSSNTDVVAEAAVEASGIKDKIAEREAARCQMARDQYDRMWNRAVDSNRLDAMEDSLRSAESQVEAVCKDK